ncbi:MAG TPA: response regulator transcription factor [Anaerolineaceae bacterium]|nr:response regulator transcription factor [Anaerolineaceae bacterium]HPN51070.1 response regulator transcription factor [Anaerolineaceae bacterium]
MIQILLVDDQTLIRQGLKMLLMSEPDLNVVGEAANGRDAIAAAQALKPDVILMDVRMPEMDGVSATREIQAAMPSCGIIILTTFDDDEYIFEGLRAGARGYLLKDVSSDEIAAAVRTVASGGALIQPSITRKVLAEFSRLTAPARPTAEPAGPTAASSQALAEPLTDREMEVLRALAEGLSNREIADRLIITEGTVKNHVSNLIAKMNVRDRTQAVLRGQELGLI